MTQRRPPVQPVSTNMFLPSIVGGDVVRVGLAIKMGRNRAGAVLGSLADRILDLMALACVAGIGALLIPEALDLHSRRTFAYAAGLLGLVLLLLAASIAIGLKTLSARRVPRSMRRQLVRLRQALQSMLRQPERVLLALAVGVTIQTGFVLLTSAIAGACRLHMPFRVWIFAWPLAKLAALLPVTLGGIGVREAALTALTAPFGAAPASTVAVGLVWETIIISGGLIAGLLSYCLGYVQGNAHDAAPAAGL